MHYSIDHKKLKKALKLENRFESEEIKTEVIKLLCNDQEESITTKSDTSIQNPAPNPSSRSRYDNSRDSCLSLCVRIMSRKVS